MPDIKCHNLYDSIYMKYPKEIKTWRPIQIGGCQGLRGRGRRNYLQDKQFTLNSWECFRTSYK